LAAGLLIGTVAVCLLVCWTSPSSSVLPEKYARINKGMTHEEVKEILGTASSYPSKDTWLWHEGQYTVTISFSPDGKVKAKRIQKLDVWDEIRSRFGV
jgi:hypothetical protein